ncbi:c-type cytochrome [Cellvibrio japonicus]|uniref:Cytochrome c4 n=1 Tax=Cellvibrio japonicus (strain Ueda107) TaxID=498211 RepID=B3PG22_CELJU|nr:c-type cytochrome [Cellvibrio japonicus]ACE83217.1 cytochrome c4 [Cellvibrio japonicus Ueda107]QEI13704.1 cytochrome c4 [Cellvibrio japonicus]QEI17278.1 cytochrome c4 [Cellvibrio japonicus]QEI20855.1 cytochrome c4 [Cellvibrio japonicus]
MKHILSNALFSVGLVLIAPGVMANGDATAGAEKAAVCGACHGADGNSLAPNFPKLAGLGEKYLLKQLKDIRDWDREQDAEKKPQTGRAVLEMTGLLSALSDQDLADIAAHFASQTTQLSGSQKLEVQVNSGIKVDALELGERIYRAGNKATGVPACTGCHAPDGKGNAAASYPRLSGQYPDYIEKQLRAFRAGDRTNDGDQMIMRSVADRLSDAEIKALANYIAGLH